MRLWGQGAAALLLAVACGGKIDDPQGKGDGGGSGGRAGSSSGASGGAPAAGGGTGRGGSYGVGGAGGGTGRGGSYGVGGGVGGVGGAGAIGGIECDPDGRQHGMPGECIPADPGNPCQECIRASCCAEWASCVATSPDNVCAWGAPNGEGEIVCFQDCVLSVVANGGVPDDETMAECAATCATPGCTTIGSRTNDMIACLSMNCLASCFMP